ncbi:coiled-coil domain-containing protein 141-like [Sitophilus oryzae]|uniref:Coiled-coil domain-containing protein 141-like n=1 Tax=Sitophilus oryzae TaxID=7048 RepID=A0A6J2XNB7_SITOR|nr:coiled-coil domain-containing protein 141-like [Sitophilus oryzae]
MDTQVHNGDENAASTSSAMSKTTTISTIAVQSGKTRIVIALLHVGDWIHLKILEITPELTILGNTLAEALELQRAHNEVLRQLQNKQSPVEELLRQADQLIATQRPRAEVGDWIHLKILEITPELTILGNTLAEALELQRAHNEVLRQLQFD